MSSSNVRSMILSSSDNQPHRIYNNTSRSKKRMEPFYSSCHFHTAEIPQTFQLKFDNNKAGLEHADANKTTAIIHEVSKGSSFYMNEQRKAESRQKQILQLRQKAAHFAQYMGGEKNAACRRRWECKVAEIEQELEAGRHFGNYIHVDMDMFYAAVEMKKDTSLATVPLAVGTLAMLSTTNYIARRYGVRSGMPGFIGRKLCPSLVIVPTDFDAYRAEAAVVRDIAFQYDPNFVSVGLDELTMEVTAYLQHHSDMTAADVAAEFRARVFAETQLTASAGIAPTATLSKIASNYNKPNGQHELCLRTREEVVNFMKDLPVRTVPGIGRSTESVLQGLGIGLLGDIYERRVELCYILTEKMFYFLLASSIGVVRWQDAGTESSTDRVTEAERKSVGMERTFGKLGSRLELQPIVQSAVTLVCSKLLEEGLVCRQIVLKIKRTSFQVQQFSKGLLQYSDDFETIRRAVDELLMPIMDQYAFIRLLGVRLTDIITKREYETQQQQHGSGIQRRLVDYCNQGCLRRRGRTSDVKRICREEEKYDSDSSGVQEIVSSWNEDVMKTSEEVVVCLTPQKKVRRSEGRGGSRDDDIIVID